jgi:hypothetical protein
MSVASFRRPRQPNVLQADPSVDGSLGAAAKEALDAAVAEALDHGVYLYAIQATNLDEFTQEPCAQRIGK